MVSDDFRRQMDGYGMTIAVILYGLPDYPWFYQTYIWQHYDLTPEFPELRKFLDFWQAELDGPLRSVRVAHKRLISPQEWHVVGHEIKFH